MSVCQNQDTFNDAYRNAQEDRMKKDEPPLWAIITITVLSVIFIIWGVILASPTKDTIHIVLSVVFAPIYVLSYYLDSCSK